MTIPRTPLEFLGGSAGIEGSHSRAATDDSGGSKAIGCVIGLPGWRPRNARSRDNRIPSEPAVAAVDLSRPSRTPMVVS
ncbi:MAG TPA: hypothetical protein P5159_13230 [Phycisphaerae bacterium]|nr:hypothetical protein [Phycisphaerae bacterium]